MNKSSYFKHLENTYKNKVIFPHKNFNEINIFIKNTFDILHINEIIPSKCKSRMNIMELNINNSGILKNTNYLIYELIRESEKNKYWYDLLKIQNKYDSEPIYIIAEKFSSEIDSTFNLLKTYLFLNIGINKEDIEERNNLYFTHLAGLELYEQALNEIKNRVN